MLVVNEAASLVAMDTKYIAIQLVYSNNSEATNYPLLSENSPAVSNYLPSILSLFPIQQLLTFQLASLLDCFLSFSI